MVRRSIKVARMNVLLLFVAPNASRYSIVYWMVLWLLLSKKLLSLSIITVLSIFGHICIMYSIFYIKKNVKDWRPGNFGEHIIETDQSLILHQFTMTFPTNTAGVEEAHGGQVRCQRRQHRALSAVHWWRDPDSGEASREGFSIKKSVPQALVRADQPAILGVGSSYFWEHVAL